VTVNTKKIRKNLKINPRDEFMLEVLIESSEVLAEDILIDVIYEDDSILIINKES